MLSKSRGWRVNAATGLLLISSPLKISVGMVTLVTVIGYSLIGSPAIQSQATTRRTPKSLQRFTKTLMLRVSRAATLPHQHEMHSTPLVRTKRKCERRVGAGVCCMAYLILSYVRLHYDFICLL